MGDDVPEWWWDLLRPGMNVLDIGANIGQYTLGFAKVVAPGKVFAVEPTPGAFAVLERTVKDLENVQLYAIALGHACETRRVFNSVDWTLLPIDPLDPRTQDRSWPHPSQRNDLKGEFIATFMMLDHFMDVVLPGVHISFVKIDTDGFEFRIIQGGRQWLQSCRPILRIEIGHAGLERVGDSSEALLAMLEGLGYGFFDDHRRLSLSWSDILSIDASNTVDVLCLPSQS